MGLVRIVSDLLEVAQGVESIITITMYYATDSLISISALGCVSSFSYEDCPFQNQIG